MRKLALLCCVVLATSFLLPALAGASAPAKAPPVKLKGKVNREGTATVKNGAIEVEQDDFYFKATFLKAKPGETITVDLANEGQAPHTFTVDSLDLDEELDPGGTGTVEVEVPDKGALVFYCRFHKASGMQGAVFSKAGQRVSATRTSDSKPASTSGSSGGGYNY